MSKVIHIQTENEARVLSKLQKQFNAHIKKIDKTKKEIEEAKKCLDIVQIAAAKDFVPLQKEEYTIRVEIIKTMDSWYDKGSLTKAEKKTLSEYLEEESYAIISAGHEELKPVFEKHSKKTYDEVEEEQNADQTDEMKMMMRMMGLEMNDEDAKKDPEEFKAFILEQLEQRQNEQYEAELNRPKTAKQLEKEAKKQEAENQLSQSIKEIYKKLVKEFHPDREQNEEEKIRKTAIMTRITEAYEKDDLLTLLQLQLEYEQISQDNLNTIADEKLKHYNKVLKEQVETLQQEYSFIMGGGFDYSHPFTRLNIYDPVEAIVKYKIELEIKRLKNLNKSLTKDLKTLKLDPLAVKEWIKLIKKNKKDQDSFSFFDDF